MLLGFWRAQELIKSEESRIKSREPRTDREPKAKSRDVESRAEGETSLISVSSYFEETALSSCPSGRGSTRLIQWGWWYKLKH